MDKENIKEDVDNSTSAKVLKTIYSVLILVIIVNCIFLIVSLVKRRNFEPIRSQQEIRVARIPNEKSNEEDKKDENKPAGKGREVQDERDERLPR